MDATQIKFLEEVNKLESSVAALKQLYCQIYEQKKPDRRTGDRSRKDRGKPTGGTARPGSHEDVRKSRMSGYSVFGQSIKKKIRKYFP